MIFVKIAFGEFKELVVIFVVIKLLEVKFEQLRLVVLIDGQVLEPLTTRFPTVIAPEVYRFLPIKTSPEIAVPPRTVRAPPEPMPIESKELVMLVFVLILKEFAS